ncbi:MAG: bifunctional DNA primase/polymerase [Candidatus Anstonellales archaeon]
MRAMIAATMNEMVNVQWEKNYMDNGILDFVLENKLRVFPLHSVIDGKCTCGNEKCSKIGKHPFFTIGWKKVATNDREKIDKLFDFGVSIRKNLGIIMEKDIVCVSVEKKNKDLIDKLLKFGTFCYTSKNSYHFWFRYRKRGAKNIAGIIKDGVEIIGNGKYVIGPGSLYVGGMYEVVNNNFEIKDFPEFLLNIRSNDRITSFVKEGNYKKIIERLENGEKVPKGARAITMLKILMYYRLKRIEQKESADELFRIAKRYSENCFEEPLNDEEIAWIVRDALRKTPFLNIIPLEERWGVIRDYYLYLLEKKLVEEGNYGALKKLNNHKDLIKELDEIFFKSLVLLDKNNKVEYRYCEKMYNLILYRALLFEICGYNLYYNYNVVDFAHCLKHFGIWSRSLDGKNYWGCYFDIDKAIDSVIKKNLVSGPWRRMLLLNKKKIREMFMEPIKDSTNENETGLIVEDDIKDKKSLVGAIIRPSDVHEMNRRGLDDKFIKSFKSEKIKDYLTLAKNSNRSLSDIKKILKIRFVKRKTVNTKSLVEKMSDILLTREFTKNITFIKQIVDEIGLREAKRKIEQRYGRKRQVLKKKRVKKNVLKVITCNGFKIIHARNKYIHKYLRNLFGKNEVGKVCYGVKRVYERMEKMKNRKLKQAAKENEKEKESIMERIMKDAVPLVSEKDKKMLDEIENTLKEIEEKRKRDIKETQEILKRYTSNTNTKVEKPAPKKNELTEEQQEELKKILEYFEQERKAGRLPW